MEVSPDRESILAVPDGPTVTVPAGAVDSAGSLAVSLVKDPPDPNDGTAVGPAWDLHLDGGAALVGEVEIAFAFEPSDDELVAGLAYWDEGLASWMPVTAKVDTDAGTVTAMVDHLSWWKPWTWHLPDVKGWVVDRISQAFDHVDVEQPTCDGEDELRSAVQITSDHGDTVMWCAGVENGRSVLRVTNARSYAVEVALPTQWHGTDVAPADGLLATVIEASANVLTPEDGHVVIGAGQTLTATAPVGTAGTVSVTPSGIAYVLTALALGLDTLAWMSAKVPGWQETGVSGAGAVMRTAWDTASCADSIDGLLAGGSPTNADESLTFFKDAVGYSFGCLADAWQKEYGAAGAAWSVLAGILAWAASAAQAVVSGVQAVVDGIRDLDGYTISMTAATRTPAVNAAEDPSTWVLSLDGFGPVHIGMTAPEAVGTGGFVEIPFCDVGALKWTGRSNGDYDVYANLNEDGVIWSINLSESPAPTDSGLDFGMTVEQVGRIYGDRLIHDAGFPDENGGYAVNGNDAFLVFWVRSGVVDAASLSISLIAGNVGPDTIPNRFSCRAAWHE